MPAQAGIHLRLRINFKKYWIPVFTGMTEIRTDNRTMNSELLGSQPRHLQSAVNYVWFGKLLKIAPQPPFLEADLRPVNRPRWPPGARVGDTEGWPAGGISRTVCGGASSAEGE